MNVAELKGRHTGQGTAYIMANKQAAIHTYILTSIYTYMHTNMIEYTYT